MQELSPVEWALRPVKKYAVFSGRAPRAEYWWFYLGTLIVSLPLALFDNVLGTEGALGVILNLALLVPWIAVTVRRLHDTDRSGWWLLGFAAAFAILGFSAVAGAFSGSTASSFTGMVVAVLMVLAASITLLVFMVLPGTDGPNRYGPDPYGSDSLREVFA